MNSLTRCQPLLGTYVEIGLSADANDDELIDMSRRAFDAVAHIDQVMSFHNPDSELSALNRLPVGVRCSISREMQEVLQMALQLSEMTEGVFDVTVAGELVKSGLLPGVGIEPEPSANWQDIHLEGDAISFSQNLLIDLGGIAKGYAVDQVFSLFGDEVWVSVNAGGDLRLSHWYTESVAIRNPLNPVQVVDVEMENTAVATSAGYYLDGEAAIISRVDAAVIEPLESVSVFAETCMLADALTKIVWLMKSDCVAILQQLKASAIRLTAAGVVLRC